MSSYDELRKYYKGYGVYNKAGKLINIGTMSDSQMRSFQNDLARERKNTLQGKSGWKVVIRKIKKK